MPIGILEETFAALAAQKIARVAGKLDEAIREVATPGEQAKIAAALMVLSLARAEESESSVTQ